MPSYDLSNIDVLEIRLDLISPKFLLKSHGYLEFWRKSLLFTYRLPQDSNQKKGHIHKKKDLKIFLSHYNSSQHIIDLEMDQKKPTLANFAKDRFRLLYSYHNFKKCISLKKMKKYIQAVQKKQAKDCIFKFAVQPQSPQELAIFLENIKELSHLYQVIGVVMGDMGMISRILADKFGSAYTYTCLGNPLAPGQMEAETIFQIRKSGNL